MYTLNPLQTYVEGEQYHDRDQTIEILMDELDTEVMDIFYKRGGETADTATKVTTQTQGRYSALPSAEVGYLRAGARHEDGHLPVRPLRLLHERHRQAGDGG